jgi:hypothetical protein
MSMAISNSKDYCAYPDLIFYYAAPSANHLYASPRKAGVGRIRTNGGLRCLPPNSLHGHAARLPEISALAFHHPLN